MAKYKSFIDSVTININPVFHDVLYIIEYNTGKTRYIFRNELSENMSKRIHNFIYTSLLVSMDKTEKRYKYGMQNIA